MLVAPDFSCHIEIESEVTVEPLETMFFGFSHDDDELSHLLATA